MRFSAEVPKPGATPPKNSWNYYANYFRTMSENLRLGKCIALEKFVTCTNIYQAFKEEIEPYPTNQESINAIEALSTQLLVPPGPLVKQCPCVFSGFYFGKTQHKLFGIRNDGWDSG